ncbi:MAG: hypothetical protein FWH05_00160 [Oscillospiraceae bacterium]|nr:hypothetical protein [Oscillospiraceae bacterium]
MNKLNKRLTAVSVSAALWLIYLILCILGFSGADTILGVAFYTLVVVVIVYISVIVFKSMLKKIQVSSAVLPGILALCSFAIFEVFSFLYFFVYRGSITDITVSYYSRCCATVFLAVTSMAIIAPPENRKSGFNIIYNMIMSAVVISALLAVITFDTWFLFLSLLTMLLLCVVPSARILFESFKTARFKPYRLFAFAVIFISVLDAVGRIFKFFYHAPVVLDVIIALSVPAYILLGLTILRFGRVEVAEHE